MSAVRQFKAVSIRSVRVFPTLFPTTKEGDVSPTTKGFTTESACLARRPVGFVSNLIRTHQQRHVQVPVIAECPGAVPAQLNSPIFSTKNSRIYWLMQMVWWGIGGYVTTLRGPALMPADEHCCRKSPPNLRQTTDHAARPPAPGPEWNPQRRRYIPDQCL